MSKKRVALKDRPEWKDFQPSPLPTTTEPTFTIKYDAVYREVLEYFFTCFHNREFSDRTLALTSEVIQHNAAQYTAWQYRRDILRHLKSDLAKEAEKVYEMIIDTPKNYQLWGHCHFIADESEAFDLESCFEFLRLVFEDDAKNYHAWSFRQFVVQKFDAWSEELEFTSTMIYKDLRNNSAWSHRFFVVEREGLTEAVIEREVRFCVQQITLAPNNESPWNYLRGLRKRISIPSERPAPTFVFDAGFDRNSLALNLRVEILQDMNTKESLTTASEICNLLASEIDPIRAKYWRFHRKIQIKRSLEPFNP
eukprot:TRINITY_DN5324_c0_g1_i1.p1 TRINITY_DN5324_c0_g1~~TRINITY_DN5324_c0_g1_i1.p1  ORF type:complete len:309 (-),score=60.34 TRINITY_DN5324_c0_g1_i1:30-956(-)